MKNFGIRGPEQVVFIGGNAKMSEFQAAMGICNLRHINRCISERKKAAERYRERLSGAQGLRLLDPQKDVQSNYSYFPVLFETDQYTRDEAAELLAANGIFARKYFYPLTSDFACYRGRGRAKAAPACYRGQDQAEAAPADRPETGRQDTPAARQAAEQVHTLPLYPELTVEEIDRICHILLKKQ
jgi:dTDP-4-amino-4,6-dideoxygalactose transaminase